MVYGKKDKVTNGYFKATSRLRIKEVILNFLLLLITPCNVVIPYKNNPHWNSSVVLTNSPVK